MISKILNSRWAIPSILTIVSGLYYYTLSSKIFTWVYVSGDAGDWLQQLHWWTVPHTFGKPLVTAIIHGLAYLPVENDAALLAVGLAVIPGAITVAITYFIALELTQNKKLSTLASFIVLASGIFLAQSTVVEQYAFTAMFISVSYLFYLKNKWTWAVIFLGLGTATHVFVAVIALFWLIIERAQWRRLLKLSPLFVLFGIAPYGLILYLMASSAPNLIAGNLSWESLSSYAIGNTTSSLAMAIVAFPQRLWEALGIFLLAFGFAWYPLFYGLKKPWDMRKKTAIVLIFVVIWFYLTNMFPSTWKYVMMAIPVMAGFAVYGLSQLKPWHTKLVTDRKSVV